MSIVSDIKNTFSRSRGAVRLIFINVTVFILVNVATTFMKLSGIDEGVLLKYIALSSDFWQFILHVWTLFTYMFLHADIFHIFFNMLWLYWMGKLFVEYIGSRQLVATYIVGGVVGGVLFLVSTPLLPYTLQGGFLLGASAGVMAVVVAIAKLIPNYPIHLFLFGEVKLKYVALISFLITTVLDFTNNTGGKIAHMGGALYGYLYMSYYKKTGIDYSSSFANFIDTVASMFTSRKSKLKVAYRKGQTDADYNANKIQKQKRVDQILDKISRSGYESLTKEERDDLFNMSK